MAKKFFTDESLATLVDETKLYVDNAVLDKVDKVTGKGLSTNDYTTAEKNKLSGIASGAEVNQNAFSNIKVGTTTIAADSKTDTLTLVGSNVTITSNATDDSVTFTVADGSTSTAGILKLTNSTSSTSTTTAATPSSVKSAYDLANTAKTNAATAQARADSAYSLAEGKVDSLSDLGLTATAAELNKMDGVTATTTELNYVDGVTSNIQTQLNGKAASSHNHAASDITSGTIAAARLPTADGTQAGITVVYPAASCTTFSSDSGTVTPLAVQKGAKMFAIPRVTSTEHAVTRFTDTEGAVENSKIIIEDVTNTRDTSKTANVLAIPAEGNKKMVYGYCTDQIDGTSFIGGVFDADATEYPYSAGLAIGGTSGNLLWKGDRVATATDLNAKQATITGGATTIASSNLTANRALISNSSGKVAVSDVTSTELGYLDGVTSNIQTQLDSHTHNYAGSSSAGGAATTALACTGNSATTTKLATAVNINGVSFDGSADITIPASPVSFGITTEGTGAAYTATVDGITSLTAGASFIMIPHTISTAVNPTLNVNGLGAKQIRRRMTNATGAVAMGYAASWLTTNKPVRLIYDGNYWIVDLPRPAAADISGTMTVAQGGTGKTSVTAGNFLLGNGTDAMTEKTPETWTFTLSDGSTVTKKVCVG